MGPGVPGGEPIAHGLLGLAIVSGLMHQTGVINGTIIGFLGLTWRFTAPVKFGDTIAAEMRVRAVKETSKPDRGVVTLAFSVTNQREERVQDALGAWRRAFALSPDDRLRDKILKAERELHVGRGYELSTTSQAPQG